MKRTNLKRSFLLSVLALLLCVSMFVGTTFAWFSETITNQNNKIMAGNLDVELYYKLNAGDTWTELTETSELFDDAALWEPGFTQVVYFKVENKGSLALKYQLGVNIIHEEEGTNVAGGPLKLSDYIEFGVIETADEKTYATRDLARAAVTSSKIISEGFTTSSELYAAANADGTTKLSEEYVTMVVYMPATTENEANHKPGTVAPYIDLGIELYATQMMNEDDTFGPDYDEEAPLPATKTESVVAGNDTVIETANGSVTVPAGATDATELTYSVKPTDVPANINVATGETLTAYEVNLLDENGQKVIATESVEASIYIGKDLVVTKLYHNDKEIDYYYSEVTGYITFKTTSFSPFTVATKDASSLDDIATADELVAAATNGGYYNVVADIDLGATVVKVPADKVLYLKLNNKTIYGESVATGKNSFLFEVYGTLTLVNGTVSLKHVGADMAWSNCTQTLYVGGEGTLNIQSATVENLGGTSMAYAIDMTNAKTITVNVESSVLSSTYIAVRVFNNSSTGMNNVTVKNTEMIGATRAFWVHIYSNTDTKGKGTKDATLNLDIYGNGNTFTATNPKYPTPICYGFDDGYFYDVEGNFVCAAADTAAGLKAAVEAGYDVLMTSDIALTEILVIDKAVTLDGNGKTLTSTAARAINVSGANGVLIKNLTVKASGERAINVIQNATNVTIDNVTAAAANYTVNVANSAPNAVVTIKNSTLGGLCTVNVAAAGANVTVTDSTINCNDDNTTEGESYAAIGLNKDAIGATITVTGSTINVPEGSDSQMARNSAEDGVITIDGSDENVTVTVAVITYPGSDYYYGFQTLQSAIDFASNGDTVTLLRDITLTESVVIPADKAITLDLNGKTVTAPAYEPGGYVCAIKNEGTLTVKGDGTITGPYSGLYSTGNLTVEGGNFTSGNGFGLLIDNIYGTEASVAVINGGTFTGVGIYNPTEVTIKGGTFNVGRDPDGAMDNVTLFVSPTFAGAPNTANVTLKGGTFNGDIYVYDDGVTETVFVNDGATINGEIRDNA